MANKQVTVRTTSPTMEDHLLIHAHVRGIKKRATMAQIVFEKGMESLEAQLPDNWQDIVSSARATVGTST